MIAIQTEIGVRVITRETLSTLSKAVTAKCHGGAVSRKRKRPKKQKEAKTRLRRFVRVGIP